MSDNVRSEKLRIRRAPKMSVFLLAGAMLGVIVALILTFGFDGTEAVSANTGVVYTTGQVFGFLLLVCIPVGLAIMGMIGVAFDRRSTRKAREITVEHEQVHTVQPEED